MKWRTTIESLLNFLLKKKSVKKKRLEFETSRRSTTFICQDVRCFLGFLQSNARPNHQHLIRCGVFDERGLPDLEMVVVVVQNGSSRSRGANEANPLRVGSQLDSPLGGDCVRGIKHGAGGDRTEHGKVLQSHLAGAVLPDADAGVRADAVQVCLSGSKGRLEEKSTRGKRTSVNQ